jgi:hypothetical protein
MFSSSRKRGGADAFENDPSFRSKGTVVLSRLSARRVSLRILQWLKTKTIRITVNLLVELGMCMRRRLSVVNLSVTSIAMY